jgi:hypothetical protein
MALVKLTILAITMTSLTYVSADACTCVKAAQRTAIKEAGAIFSAKVVSYDQGFRSKYRFDPAPPFIHSRQTWEISTTFSVSKVWKGAIPQEITLKSITSLCGGQFTAGGEYLVYAYWQDDNLITLPCTRTELLSNAGDDLRILGEGKPPIKVQQFTDKLSALGSLVMIMTLVAGAFWLWAHIARRKTL